MTAQAAEVLNTIRSMESAHVSSWDYDSIRGVVADFHALPVPARREVLAGLGYAGTKSMTGAACDHRLNFRLTERLGSWQRMEGIRGAAIAAAQK